MNTPIIKISDDQTEITHENGVVTVFEESVGNCIGCQYFDDDLSFDCEKYKVPCMMQNRKDGKHVIFKLKHNEHTI